LPPESPISLQAQWIGITSSVREKVITFANRWLLVMGADSRVQDKRALLWAYLQIVGEATPADVTGSSDVSDHLAFLDQFEDMVGDVSIPAWGATLPEVSAFAKSFTENAKTLAINNIPDSNTPIPGMGGWFTCKDLRRLALNPDGTEVELLTRLQDFLCLNTTSHKRIHVLKGTTTGIDTSRSMREVSITLPFQCDACQGIFNVAPVDPQSSSQSQSNNPNYTHQVCIFLILSIYLCC
jgi:hypothetical protein